MTKEELLQSVYNDATEKIIACGIALRPIRDVRINTTSKKTWGWCKYAGNNSFDIEIADVLVDEKYYDDLLDTMIHELLHAAEGAVGHGKVWKAYAQRIKDAYGIEITRTNSRKNVEVDETEYRHKLICTSCKREWLYTRSCGAVRNPDKCKCPVCKTRTIIRGTSPRLAALCR